MINRLIVSIFISSLIYSAVILSSNLNQRYCVLWFLPFSLAEVIDILGSLFLFVLFFGGGEDRS